MEQQKKYRKGNVTFEKFSVDKVSDDIGSRMSYFQRYHS